MQCLSVSNLIFRTQIVEFSGISELSLVYISSSLCLMHISSESLKYFVLLNKYNSILH